MAADTTAVQERVKELTPGILASVPATLENVLSGKRTINDSDGIPLPHQTRIAWCGSLMGDGYRARCSCGWMGEPTPVKAVALVDCDKHEESES